MTRSLLDRSKLLCNYKTRVVALIIWTIKHIFCTCILSRGGLKLNQGSLEQEGAYEIDFVVDCNTCFGIVRKNNKLDVP